jgi:aminoglycoside phosphotransferase (APT) family kinase protein
VDDNELQKIVESAAAAQIGWVPEMVKSLNAVESEVFELTAGSKRAVFKARGWEGNIALEVWACEKARNAGIRTSEVFAVDFSRSIFPRPFYVAEFVEGIPLQKLAESGVEVGELHRAVGEELRKLHAIEPPGWGWLNRELLLETSKARVTHSDWASDIKAHMEWSLPYLEENKQIVSTTTAKVEELFDAFKPSGVVQMGSLLHGDMRAEHVLVDLGNAVLPGLIDFGDASPGDPLWDIACYSEDSTKERDWLLEGYGLNPSDEEIRVLHFYCLIRGLDVLRWNHDHGFNLDGPRAVIDKEFSWLLTR